MKSKVVVSIAAVLLATAGTVFGHHSFAATYVPDKQIKIEGKIIQFLFRNPHSFVHVEAPDEKGVMQKWVVEWGGIGQLNGQGVNRETLRVNDHVVITGNPARDAADYRIRLVTLRRTSDGFGWGARPGETVE